MYVYIYIYIYTYVCTYLYIYIYIYIYTRRLRPGDRGPADGPVAEDPAEDAVDAHLRGRKMVN